MDNPENENPAGGAAGPPNSSTNVSIKSYSYLTSSVKSPKIRRLAGRRGRKKEYLRNFISVPWDVVNSNAYKPLSYGARAALVMFIGKGRNPYNTSEGKFSFTYKEATDRYGYSRAAFSRVIKQLHSTGFIDIDSSGGLRGCHKSDTKYRLSERWRLYGKPEFQNLPRYDQDQQVV